PRDIMRTTPFFRMHSPNRRKFIQQTATALAATSTLGLPTRSRAAGANERVIIGVVGPGGMGSNLLNSFVEQKDVEIAYVCDADSNRMGKAAQTVEKKSGKAPKQEKDMRRVFEDKAVDAVIIATPDHWHAPATILACEAGKHVYVEK